MSPLSATIAGCQLQPTMEVQRRFFCFLFRSRAYFSKGGRGWWGNSEFLFMNNAPEKVDYAGLLWLSGHFSVLANYLCGQFFFLDVAVAIKLLLLLIFVAGDFLDDCCRVLWASVAIKIFRLMTTETGFCVRQLKFSSGWNFPVLATSKEKDVIKPRRAIINTITITIKGTVLKRQGFSSWREGFKLGFAVNGFVLIEKVWSFWMTEIEFNCEIDLT